MCLKVAKTEFDANGRKEVPKESNRAGPSKSYERDDIFSSKRTTVELDVWSRAEFKMIAAAVTFLEFSILLFATTKALFSIVNPKIKSGLYSLCIILPLSILLPAFFSRVEAVEEAGLDD